ncbi:hypothetical protein BWQ96_04342 [Gracilariopsis chorda]|uniref:Uncharacterized protein n=1 Tax=Gracilariopsis chorda TaxID=448386 RepID=A0A2V3IW19_9FLOR|nr:hypothetical protein BWQ96_04342 [Gracilariopsis chorda]|eukprot:PXF45907.1 hypothetical protein BWQ96_04342 [Gracilariopsis chorda]
MGALHTLDGDITQKNGKRAWKVTTLTHIMKMLASAN